MADSVPPIVDYKFLTGLLLEIAQERCPQKLLQRLVRRVLEGPSRLIVVAWLIDDADGPEAITPAAERPDQNRWLYAVAGGTTEGEPHRLPDDLVRIPVGVGPIGRIAVTQQSVVINDLDKNPGDLTAIQDWLRAEQIRGFLGIPVVHGGRVFGVAAVFDHASVPDEAPTWGRMFADHVAAAIANARAFEEIERLKTQLEQHNAYLREAVVGSRAVGDLVGQSAALQQVVSQIDLVAPTDASALILGETGTGK